MNIFLTGSTGFVGRHLKARLEYLGYNVFCYTRNTALITEMVDEDFPSPEIIIHCAGEINLQHKMFESNVILTERLLKFARNCGTKKFIHIGSSSEYGNINEYRREDMPCTVTDFYGATKIAATAMCQGYASQFNMDVCIARPFSLYGPNDTPRKLIPRLISSAFTKQVVKVGDGYHDWVYIDDFVNGIVGLINCRETKGQIFNFGSGTQHSNLEVINTLNEIMLMKPVVEFNPGGMVNNWVADPFKTYSILGWRVTTPLREGLSKILY